MKVQIKDNNNKNRHLTIITVYGTNKDDTVRKVNKNNRGDERNTFVIGDFGERDNSNLRGRNRENIRNIN